MRSSKSAIHSTSRLYFMCFLAVVSLAFGMRADAQDDSNFDVAGMQAIRGTVAKVDGDSIFVRLRGGVEYKVR
jgi:hypothetical protein